MNVTYLSAGVRRGADLLPSCFLSHGAGGGSLAGEVAPPGAPSILFFFFAPSILYLSFNICKMGMPLPPSGLDMSIRHSGDRGTMQKC